MILKSITLQNFRSYGEEPTTLELGRGLLLFEGEIGSGKSSLLYAIEFALFGLAELETKYILRNSADSARVELEFEVSGHDYKVIRTIEKKRKQIQTRGWLQGPDGDQQELSPTELRTKILQILNFREKQSSRASSRIYRYAVFTPQEMMKEVLAQKPEERIETLRRAFGVEDYSFAGSNAELVISHLDSERKVYSKVSEDLKEKESDLSMRKETLLGDDRALRNEERALAALTQELKEVRDTLESLDSQVRNISQTQALMPELEKSLHASQLKLLEAKQDAEKYRRTLSEIERAERELSFARKEYEDYCAAKQKLKGLSGIQRENLELEKNIAKHEQSISSSERAIMDQISSLEVERSNLEKRLASYDKSGSRLMTLEADASKLKKEISELPAIQNRLESTKSEIGSLTATMAAKQAELEATLRKLSSLDGISNESKCPLCGQKLSAEHLSTVSEEFNGTIYSLEFEIEEANSRFSELKFLGEDLDQKRAKLLGEQRRLEELEEEISKASKSSEVEAETRIRFEETSSSIETLRSKLETREFALEDQSALGATLRRKEELAGPLKEFSEFEENVAQFEDSGKLKAFQSAEATASRKQEASQMWDLVQERAATLEKEISSKASEIAQKKRELEAGEPILLKYSRAKESVEKLGDEHSAQREVVAQLSERARREAKEIEGLQADVEKLRTASARATLYKGVSSWLEEYFLPAISEIERHVLASINDEFSDTFQRLFSMLVEDADISATVDDSFTPVVESSGYELDVHSLSGGERTAVALAYRLSLNFMVKRANEAMHANLLILDEPTEGFSKEQIYRLRSVVEELSCDQIIVVTHERDLETMADRVYRVEKVNGESRVSTS